MRVTNEEMIRAHVARRWGLCSRENLWCRAHRDAYWPREAPYCSLFADRLDDAEMLTLDVKLMTALLENEGMLSTDFRFGVRWMERSDDRVAWFSNKERAMSWAAECGDAFLEIVVEERLATSWRRVAEEAAE